MLSREMGWCLGLIPYGLLCGLPVTQGQVS